MRFTIGIGLELDRHGLSKLALHFLVMRRLGEAEREIPNGMVAIIPGYKGLVCIDCI